MAMLLLPCLLLLYKYQRFYNHLEWICQLKGRKQIKNLCHCNTSYAECFESKTLNKHIKLLNKINSRADFF